MKIKRELEINSESVNMPVFRMPMLGLRICYNVDKLEKYLKYLTKSNSTMYLNTT